MSEAETTTRKKKYAPTDDDYKICCVRIEEAENGVSVKCEYELTDEAQAKIKGDGKGDSYVPYDVQRKTDSYVFEDKKDAIKHITGELNKMWGDGAKGGDEVEED